MLARIADDLWSWDYSISMPGGVELPTRSAIVRLEGGALVVLSPAKLDDANWAEIEALGPVRHLVGPNCFHHLYLGPAADRYPDAVVYTAPGCQRSDRLCAPASGSAMRLRRRGATRFSPSR